MPPKPWQVAPSSGTSTPLGTSHANDGQVKPWQTGTTATGGDSAGPTTAERPWDASGTTPATDSSALAVPGTTANGLQTYGSPYGTQSSMYGTQTGPYSSPTYGRPMYSPSPLGGGMYNSYGGVSGSGMYGGTSYGGMYGGSPYGSMYGSSMYGGNSMYNRSPMYGTASPYGGTYGSGYSGAGMYGANYGIGSPSMPLTQVAGHGPNGPDQQPGGLLQGARTRWQVFMGSLHGLMQFFGRVSFLMDENAHAVHFFITALLQMLDRASFLWGELARFVLRLLGYKFWKQPRAAGSGSGSVPSMLSNLSKDRAGTATPSPAASQASAVPAMLEAAWKSQ